VNYSKDHHDNQCRKQNETRAHHFFNQSGYHEDDNRQDQ